MKTKREPKTREELFQEHLSDEAKHSDSIAADGCFYCGGNHPSDCCSEARADFWNPYSE